MPSPDGLTAGATKGHGGFWGSVMRGMFTIIVMGINAFCAAIATQVYKIFTSRWRDGGGSEIPVINSAPGGGDSSSVGTPGSKPGSDSKNVSSEFLNRYRD